MQSVMDTRDSVDTERSGLTRRQIIQGAALGGAAFWAVPVIDSVTNMAAAVGSGGVPYCYSSCIEQSNCGVNGFGGAICVEPGRLPTTAHVPTARTSGCRATTAPSFLTELCLTPTFYDSSGTTIVPRLCVERDLQRARVQRLQLRRERQACLSGSPCDPGVGTCKAQGTRVTTRRSHTGRRQWPTVGFACYSQAGPGSSTSNVVTISSDGKTLTFDFSSLCVPAGGKACPNVAWNDLCFQVNCSGFTSGTSPAEKGC